MLGPGLPIFLGHACLVAHSTTNQCLLLTAWLTLLILQPCRPLLSQPHYLTWKETLTQWKSFTCFRLKPLRITMMSHFVTFLPGKDIHPWLSGYLLSQALSGIEQVQWWEREKWSLPSGILQSGGDRELNKATHYRAAIITIPMSSATGLNESMTQVYSS